MAHNASWLAIIILLALLALLALISPALAHSPDAAHGEWLSSLTNKWGGSCCNMQDCEHHPTRIVGDHYEVLIKGEWRVVPEDAILRIPNPTGEPVACWYGNAVRCFVPASAT